MDHTTLGRLERWPKKGTAALAMVCHQPGLVPEGPVLDKNSSASLQIVTTLLKGRLFVARESWIDRIQHAIARMKSSAAIVPSPPPPNINYLIGIALNRCPRRPLRRRLGARLNAIWSREATAKSSCFNEKGT